MTRRFAELLVRAKEGSVTPSEKEQVKRALSELSDGQDRYEALFVIGKAGGPADADVVESFLACRDQPMLTRLALQILCSWWGLGHRYREHVLRYVAGVDWDLEDGGFVRSVAISAAGELARSSNDAAVTSALFTLYSETDEPDEYRRSAYAAILRAAGRHWGAVPGVSSDAWRDDPDLEAIDALRRRLRGA